MVVTNVKYTSLKNILSDIGGLFTSIYAVIVLIFSLVVYKSWETSIYKECTGKTKMEQSDMKKIKSRISYKGIYDLYDTIDT